MSYNLVCGFAGLVSVKGLTMIENYIREESSDKAYLIPESLEGPDEKGSWKMIKIHTFSHTRLKDIGSQKLLLLNRWSSDDFVLCYNGEIYNLKELKNTLQIKGYTVLDPPVIRKFLIAGWHYWGPEILNKLDGMFAFSIWDKKKKLFLARDRFGKKPLVFSLSENTLAFSSDLEA